MISLFFPRRIDTADWKRFLSFSQVEAAVWSREIVSSSFCFRTANHQSSLKILKFNLRTPSDWGIPNLRLDHETETILFIFYFIWIIAYHVILVSYFFSFLPPLPYLFSLLYDYSLLDMTYSSKTRQKCWNERQKGEWINGKFY